MSPTAALSNAPSELPTDERQTVGEMFLGSVDRFGSRPAILRKQKGRFEATTYQQLYTHAAATASGLVQCGLKKGDRLALISENRAEWVYMDLACQLLGIVDVPIYPTLPSNQVEYILRDSGASAIVVSDQAQLSKVKEVRERCPDLRLVIIIEPGGTDSLGEQTASGTEILAPGTEILTLNEMVRRGSLDPLSQEAIRIHCSTVEPDDLSSIVYTSGTTGEPKGAMLTHWNFMSNALSVVHILPINEHDVFLSFLPLNHVFERLGGYYFPLSCGSAIAYAESALRVKQNLPEVNPTVMIGVPRLFDGIRDGILSQVAKAPVRKQKLFRHALRVGTRRMQALDRGKSPGPLTAVQWAIADRLVFSKIREKVGCGRMRFFVSGSAPMLRTTAEFLIAAGIGFLEGYGLTETSPVTNVNKPGRFKLGSVGPPIPGVEVSIADDGEICCRGPNIMQGYLNKPVETSAAIDADGWFHTGDLGRLDADNYLYITGRKKDLLVLATGKKVAPQPIEALIRASDYVKEVVVLGDRMSSCVALVVPDLEKLGERAAALGWEFAGPAELVARPEARKFIKSEVDRLCVGLAEFERVRQVALIERDFSVENGELTPTLKVRRGVVTEHYGDLLKTMGGH